MKIYFFRSIEKSRKKTFFGNFSENFEKSKISKSQNFKILFCRFSQKIYFFEFFEKIYFFEKSFFDSKTFFLMIVFAKCGFRLTTLIRDAGGGCALSSRGSMLLQKPGGAGETCPLSCGFLQKSATLVNVCGVVQPSSLSRPQSLHPQTAVLHPRNFTKKNEKQKNLFRTKYNKCSGKAIYMLRSRFPSVWGGLINLSIFGVENFRKSSKYHQTYECSAEPGTKDPRKIQIWPIFSLNFPPTLIGPFSAVRRSWTLRKKLGTRPAWNVRFWGCSFILGELRWVWLPKLIGLSDWWKNVRKK